MRIPLIGDSAAPYSLAAGAQQSVNCYVETLQDETKNKYVLRGRPGITLFKDLTTINASATPVRGLWSGGGRLFVAAGTKFMEVDSSGALVGSTSTVANDAGSTPVTILPNSNQLLLVSAGSVYCDNGAGPVQVTFPALSGTAVSFNKQLSRSLTPNSGTGNTDTFDVGMVGQTITYNGSNYTVQSVTNPQLLTLTTSAGVHSDKDWSSTPILTAPNGVFFDGYYLVPRSSSRQFNQSGLLDGTTWNALDSDLKEGYPDNIMAAWAEPPLLYMLGSETMQAYRDTGKAAGTSFETVDGGFARIGLAATWSCCSIMGKLHMLAGGTYGQVVAVRMDGVSPVRISTHAVEEALRTVAFPNQGVSYSYVERGHWFWVIGLDGGNAWVYDATESAKLGEPQWHERAQWDGTNLLPYTPRFHTFIPEWGSGTGAHIVGDWASGKLYTMDSDVYSDAGENIKYVRTLAYVYNEGKRVYHRRIEFELETGTSAVPAVLKLDWSDDRGQTWGTGAGVGTTMTLGPGVTGVYTTRYYAVALGSSRGRIYRLSIIGKGRQALIDATLEAEMGDS